MENQAIKTNDLQKAYLNPYIAGVLLGVTILLSYLILGTGLGASAALARLGAAIEMLLAPNRTLGTEYFGGWGSQPLRYYLVFMVIGVFFGGLISAILTNRWALKVERGAKSSSRQRLIYALAGGILAGFASRLAGGCTSGQALSGGAVLASGSLIFLVCVFAGGYGAAWFVRRQWDD